VTDQTSKRRYTLRKRAEAVADTRRRITDAAVTLHGSVGPAHTTVTAVAELAGVQRHTVYRHFPTENDLYAACSGAWAATNPLPDANRWRSADDPYEQLVAALEDLYAFYERTEQMLANVLRDEPFVAALGPLLADFRAYLDDVARTLTRSERVQRRRRPLLRGAIRHAIDFATWHSIVRDNDMSTSDAVQLMAAWVQTAAGDLAPESHSGP